MYRDHRKGPGGPPGGATYPGGPRGLKVEGNQPLVGWGAPLGPPPMRLGLGTLGGSSPLPWGARHPFPPLGRRPPNPRWVLAGPPSQGGLYKGGEGGLLHPSPWRLPLPPVTPLPPVCAWRSPAGIPATSTTTPSCCWISINLSFPLAGSSWRRCLPNHTCVERGGAVHSALGHR